MAIEPHSTMIRAALPEDIPSIVVLQKSIEAEDAIWGYGADAAKDWAGRDLTYTLVARDDAGLQGFIDCCPRPYEGECVFPSGSQILEITELVVAPGERGRGLGHALVEAARRRANAAGFTHLRVYSAVKRFDDILRFYRSCGFSPWYLEMVQEIESAPALAG